MTAPGIAAQTPAGIAPLPQAEGDENAEDLDSLSFLMMIVLFIVSESTKSIAASPSLDECGEVCYMDTECSTECYTMIPDGPMLEMDCGEYTEGQCSNTCSVICDQTVDGETECNDFEGSPSTCEDYGLYLHCGDDFCAPFVESCTNCSADCVCATPVSVVFIDPYDPDSLCNNRSAAGLGSMPCPELLEGGTGMSCGQKALVLADRIRLINILAGYLDYYNGLKSTCSCSDYDTSIANLWNAIGAAQNYYASVAAMSCYPVG